MTATVTSTENQADRRILPGDGKLNPVRHAVRIVVVDSSAASESHGPDQSHGLTDPELRAAEVALKKKDPPPSDGSSGLPESVGASSKNKPSNMFEALKPTDIVAVGREPASVRRVDSSGKPVSVDSSAEADQIASTLRLFAHDDRHKDTVLRVWTESDTIEYQCDEEFEIVRVERAGWKIYGAPDNPFDNGELPYRAQRSERATGEKPSWVWTSSILPATANNQQYKLTFRIKGELIDPDVACGDPPPS